MFKENCTQYCENCLKLQNALDEIEARIQLENADDCLLDVMEIIQKAKDINVPSKAKEV